MPHPAIFAFHKLIIAKMRKNKDKEAKDRDEAVQILKALIDKRESAATKRLLKSILLKWQAKVLGSLKEMGELELVAVLKWIIRRRVINFGHILITRVDYRNS
jgi:hypothetical protein